MLTIRANFRCSVQYRADARQGFYRTYAEGNRTEERPIVYVVESAFHEMMLQVFLRHSVHASRAT